MSKSFFCMEIYVFSSRKVVFGPAHVKSLRLIQVKLARPPRYPARQASLARPAAPRTAKLCWATQFCGIRVRPRTRHVPHGSCGPWKHLLARSGFLELVLPVVVHFLQLMWLLAFSVTFASLACRTESSNAFGGPPVSCLPTSLLRRQK